MNSFRCVAYLDASKTQRNARNRLVFYSCVAYIACDQSDGRISRGQYPVNVFNHERGVPCRSCFPSLWQPSNKSYKDTIAKDNAWKQVCTQVNSCSVLCIIIMAACSYIIIMIYVYTTGPVGRRGSNSRGIRMSAKVESYQRPLRARTEKD